MIPRARRRRQGGGALLLGAAVLGIAVVRGGPGSAPTTVSIAHAAVTDAPCIPGIICLTPSPSPSRRATARPRTPPPATQPSSPPPPGSSAPPSQVFVGPGQTTLPTLPPESPSPGTPPAPPELSVQSVLLATSDGDSVSPGMSVLVEATCVARRGADSYSVPHAKVTFTLSAPPGSTAGVTPAQADSGDTGIATVSVDAGNVEGDLVLVAASGNATGELTIHVEPDATSISASASSTDGALAGRGSSTPVDSGGTTGGRAVAVALLVALGAAVLVTTLVRVGVLPRVASRRGPAAPKDGVSSR